MSIIVSLTFDDGNESCFTNFYPILREFGLRGSFYIVTEQIGAPGRLSWEQVEKLYSYGNEIGAHTHTHPHLTRLSEDLLDFELRKSQEILAPFNVRTLAYPFGDYDDKVVKCAAKYYLVARGYNEPKEKVQSSGVNILPILEKERHALKVLPTDYLSSLMNECDERIWVIFVFHGFMKVTTDRIIWAIKNRKVNITSVVGFLAGLIKPKTLLGEETSDLKLLCQLIYERGIEVLPVNEVVEKYLKEEEG